MPEAARLHDPIDHSRSLGGLIAGAVIGGLAVTAIVLTAPVSVPAVIGGAAVAGTAAVAGGTVLGAGLGELIGGLSFARYTAGDVAQPGSPDVWVNGRRAARAHLDTVDCSRHPARPVIAQGSGTVLINRQPAARKGDRTACDAVIAAGSRNVFIGGPTVTTDDISPEVSPLIHRVMLGVGLASAAILVGPAAALFGLAGGMIGGSAVHAVTARVFGDGSDLDRIFTFAGAMAGGGLAGKGGAWLDRNYEIQSTGLGMNGGGSRIVPRQPVKPLDVGTFGDQAPRSVRDGLTPDHIPSFAAVKAAKEAQIGRPLTTAEATRLRNGTNTMMIDTDIHQQVSRTYGGRNTPARIGQDAQDLEAAVGNDKAAYESALKQRGYSQQQIDAAFDNIHNVNRAKGIY